jgi:hypothetical protein
MQCVCPGRSMVHRPRAGLREGPNAVPGLRRNWDRVWSLRQESNLYLALRRRSFYPLNYGGLWV